MARGKGQIVNRQTLAGLWGASLPTVDAWVRAGCPYVEKGGRGKEWTFDTADVSRWHIERAQEEASGSTLQDDAALKRRRAVADTLTAELEFAKARDMVAPLDQVERALSKVFAEVQAKLRALPGRVAPRLVGETDERKLKAVLLDEIDKSLEVLADIDVLADDDDASDEEEVDA